MYNKNPVRRSQLISPWGIGSIIPFPGDESLMIAGLDRWTYTNEEEFIIRDDRLQKRLGVEALKLPPDFRNRKEDPSNCNLSIPAVRFPTWMYCPHCGTMQKSNYYSPLLRCNAHQWAKGRNCNPNAKYKRVLIPERFVVVCENGHIDDFPVIEWLHAGSGKIYNKDTCVVRRSTGGASASLTGVFYECSCGARKSIGGATKKGALAKIGYTCKGTKPWLGIVEDKENPCGRTDVSVLLRGASNVWFANTMSSIFIPRDSDTITRKIKTVLDEREENISSRMVDGNIDKQFINLIAEIDKVDPDELYAAYMHRIGKSVEIVSDQFHGNEEDEYRFSEYQVLKKNSGSDVLEFNSLNFPISKYNQLIHPYFSSISLVPKLRETRAFTGFSRIEPKEMTLAESKAMLSRGNENWLPAIQVFGEGLFFEFNRDTLLRWATNPYVINRIKRLDVNLKMVPTKNIDGELKPEFVLIHTFAHLLINQLSIECGYGSSSLRERIYCEKYKESNKMYGVLIYTASGDTEGSLGGLVRQGETGRIESIILSAIKNAQWCSVDPLCISSQGQGPDSCNLAACYNCSLLPETSCEEGNKMLDRGVVIGTIENPEMGYFYELITV
jgi:hypothetical protein